MRTWTTFFLALLLSIAGGAGAAQLSPDERTALRERLEQRFDIVPLSDAVGLRPKARMGDIRLIEVGDTISINGAIVTGQELRERVGADADAILRLTYLDEEARRQFTAQAPAAPSPPAAPEPPLERPARPDPGIQEPAAPPSPQEGRRRSGERVRIFGDVHVRENETVDGQAIAVMGSVRIDGEVADQVVAVMGSVHIGPKAIVRGDVVSVGGRIYEAEGSQVRGTTTEVALGGWSPRRDGRPLVVGPRWRGAWDGFDAVPRLIGSTFRLLLLALLAAVAFLVARPVVEGAAERVSGAPVHATLVGMLAILLLGPVLFLLAMVFVISFIGIPLLVTIPFILLALLLLALAGFSGTAYAVGQWARRRFNMTGASPFLDVSLGVAIILLPVLLGRVIALAGWWGNPASMLLIGVGLLIEFIAWSAGFGAVLANAFGRWQARRAARVVTPPHTATPPPNVGP